MTTLFLNPKTWDLEADANGNIAVADEPYALAQDVASAIKLFSGELWYDTSKGIPHFETALESAPSLSLYRRYLTDAATSVEGVKVARADIDLDGNRVLGGRVAFNDRNNNNLSVSL